MMLWFYDIQVSILWGKSQYIVTIVLQSDPVAILIIFAVRFSAATNRGKLLFQGSIYSTVYSWIRYMWAIQLGLIDAGSSMRSLSVLLSAMVMSLRTRTALEITQWASLTNISIRNCALRILAMAIIQEWRLFRLELLIVWLLSIYIHSRIRWYLCSGTQFNNIQGWNKHFAKLCMLGW